MDCEAYREQIFLAVDGALSAEEQEALAAHLAVCRECRAVWESLDAVSQELRELEPVPEGFAANVMAAVNKEKKIIDINTRRAAVKKRFSMGRIGVWAACAALILVAALSQMPTFGERHGADTAAVLTESAAVYDMVEAEEAAPMKTAGTDAEAFDAAGAMPENAVAEEEAMPEAAEMPMTAAAEEPAEEPAADMAMNGIARDSALADTPDALMPCLMVGGQLYCTTGEQVPAEVDDSAVLGEIVSVVPLSEWPQTEGEANFDALGAPYAMTADGLLVRLDGEWTRFEPME